MRMLERWYRQIQGRLDGLSGSNHFKLADAVVVDISPVATQLLRALPAKRHFDQWEKICPVSTPPWPVCWIEWDGGYGIETHKHCATGMMVRSDRLPDSETNLLDVFVTNWGEKASRLMGAHQKKAAQLAEGARTYRGAGKEIGWGAQGYVIAECSLHGGLEGIASWYACFDKEGAWLPLISDIQVYVNTYGDGALPSPAEVKRELDAFPAPHQIVSVAMYAFGIAHCKNVRLGDLRLPRASQRRLRKRGRPGLRYKVLEIQPMGGRAAEGGESRGSREVTPRHIQRGHFKDYREKGLFGQHFGIYWWNMHARGSRKAGVVEKDYQI